MELDAVVVGHATVDVNVLPHGVIENVMGGTPTYAGFTLANLGDETGVISKIGKDFPEHFPPLFSKFGLNTEGILATFGSTTKFENTYNEEGERKQVCKEMADSISPSDIPQAYLNAKSFYVSPVAQEVSPATMEKISEGEGVVMLDPQGLFRNIDPESGEIELEVPDNFPEYLEYVDIIKLGKDEIPVFDKSHKELLEYLRGFGPELAILTLGEEGCKVLQDDEVVKVDSLDVDSEDLTGAGDVFGAAFLSRYLETKNPKDSARFGNVAAGLKIEYKGPTGFPSEEETEELL